MFAKAAAIPGPIQMVKFEDDQITLDIPEEGIVLENGWTITPHTYPGVSLHYTTINCPPCIKHPPPYNSH